MKTSTPDDRMTKNTQPIETARDPDLRLSKQAMIRASQQARALAIQTGTSLVVSIQGVVLHIKPAALPQSETPNDCEH
jgi:hypothetical protein